MKENDVFGLRGFVSETLTQLGPRDDVNFDLTINKNSRSISIGLTIYAKDKYYEEETELPTYKADNGLFYYKNDNELQIGKETEEK